VANATTRAPASAPAFTRARWPARAEQAALAGAQARRERAQLAGALGQRRERAHARRVGEAAGVNAAATATPREVLGAPSSVGSPIPRNGSAARDGFAKRRSARSDETEGRVVVANERASQSTSR
jgi:hypothetical protein